MFFPSLGPDREMENKHGFSKSGSNMSVTSDLNKRSAFESG